MWLIEKERGTQMRDRRWLLSNPIGSHEDIMFELSRPGAVSNSSLPYRIGKVGDIRDQSKTGQGIQQHALEGSVEEKEVIDRETQLQGELDEWLAQEELMWGQRSRVEWLKEGDSNTSFFYIRASHRKKKNTVKKIKGREDNWITKEAELCGEADSWDLIKNEVIDFALRFLNGGGDLEQGINNTLITLIPKQEDH
ncbi:hypothetical protein QQ045_022276 [Rhodiola kirilowii]